MSVVPKTKVNTCGSGKIRTVAAAPPSIPAPMLSTTGTRNRNERKSNAISKTIPPVPIAESRFNSLRLFSAAIAVCSGTPLT